jgi:hypothetical protein
MALSEAGERQYQRWRQERRQRELAAIGQLPDEDIPPPPEPPPPELDNRPKVWNATELEPAAQPRWLATNRLPRAKRLTD